MDPDDLGFQHVFEPGQTRGAALLLHGTGADEHDLLPLGRKLAPRAPRLSPLGKVREGTKARWFRREREGVFDEEDLRERAAELAGFLDDAKRAYGVDGFVAIGFSNGANIAAALLLLQPDALRGAVLFRAMTPLVPDEVPDLAATPVYIASARSDPLIELEDVERLVELLEQAGAEVTHRVADAGHGLSRSEIEPARAWLDEHEDLFDGGSA